MPRSGRGGKRQGQPGVAYTNRTDLNQAPRAVPDQTYGEAGQQLAAQRAVPLPAQPGPVPGELPSLTAPSARPGEAVTAGLSMGAGPGPETLGVDATSATLTQLRAIYLRFPTEDLRELIEDMERR